VTVTATDARHSPATQGWSVLLPPGWTSLPTAPDAAPAAIRRLLDRTFEGRARDELVQVRVELDRLLREQCAKAAELGATHLHTLTEPVGGVPVSASLVGVPVTVTTDDEMLDALTVVLGGAAGVVDAGETRLGDHFALRRVRRTPAELGGPRDAPTPMATHVDYVVALPDESALILSFTTTTEPVHEELIVLFEAIASTLTLA